jgi:hypothetical protein
VGWGVVRGGGWLGLGYAGTRAGALADGWAWAGARGKFVSLAPGLRMRLQLLPLSGRNVRFVVNFATRPTNFPRAAGGGRGGRRLGLGGRARDFVDPRATQDESHVSFE